MYFVTRGWGSLANRAETLSRLYKVPSPVHLCFFYRYDHTVEPD